LIPFLDIVSLFLLLLLAAGAIFKLFQWKLKGYVKPGLLTTFVLAFYLFYGAVSDAFKQTAFLSDLSRYRYLIPLFLATCYFYFGISSAQPAVIKNLPCI
jgi:hypothetical protein